MKRIGLAALILTVALLAMPMMVFAVPVNFGNSTAGTAGDSILNIIRGTAFICPVTGTVQSITAYIVCNTQAKHMKAAIYDSSDNLLASTDEVLVESPGGAYVPEWVTFTFSSPPTVTAGTTYILVAWSESNGLSGSADLYYISSSSQQFLRQDITYGSWPTTASLAPDSITSAYKIACIYATVDAIPGNVVPEVPWGPITASASMILALVGYVTYPKWRKKL